MAKRSTTHPSKTAPTAAIGPPEATTASGSAGSPGASTPVAPPSGSGPPPQIPIAAPSPSGSTNGATLAATPSPRAVSSGPKAVASLRKPRGNQAILAPAMAQEILAASAAGTYTTAFGATAPEPNGLANGLVLAAKATQQVQADNQALANSRSDRNQSWNTVLTGPVASFETCFHFALSQNESLAQSFPTTVVFLKTGSEIGARGAATRKANTAKKTSGTPSK